MQAALVAVIAVLGTLGGALISGLLQHKNAIRSEDAAKSERLRQERLEACIEFGQSIGEYRVRKMGEGMSSNALEGIRKSLSKRIRRYVELALQPVPHCCEFNFLSKT
jgi:hypothetical protein